MIRLAISVEGQTEEAFVKNIITAHLLPMEVAPSPILLGRARTTGGGGNVSIGGGNVSIERLVSEMVRLCQSFDAVTSLVDFYGFRNKGDRTVEALEKHLKQEIDKKIPDDARVFPYVQKYEFEGLLFSDAAAFGAIGAIGRATDQDIEKLAAVRRQFVTPEDINDNPASAPSKRIMAAVSGYRKRLHGPLVARETGLEKIRGECPRFCAWLTRLEGLAMPA